MALFLPPLRGGDRGRSPLDVASQGEGRPADLRIRPARLDPDVDVDPARARGLWPPDQPDRLQRFACHHRHVADLRPGNAWDRIEVDSELIGTVEVLGSDRMRVEIDAAEIDDPGQARGLVDDDLVGGPTRGERQGRHAHPLGPVLGRPLLEEEITRGPIDESFQGHRSAAHADQGTVSDRQVIADEVQLRVPGLREVDLVRVRDRHVPVVDPEDLLSRRHVANHTASHGLSWCSNLGRSGGYCADVGLSIHGLAVRREDEGGRCAAAGHARRNPMRYLLLIYTAEPTEAVPEDVMATEMEAYNAFGRWVQERGLMRAGEALHPTSAATTVRVRDGKTIATDGPFAETKEALGGFYLIEAANLDEAIEAAARIPGSQHGSIEIRPIWEFAAEPTAEAVASAK